MNELQINQNRDPGAIAGEINLIKDQANKILLSSSVEIGKRLKEAKELVGHGNWIEWLEQSVNYSARTASNLIKIHEEYGVKMLESGENSNRQLIADLGYTQAVAMLKLDFSERENFVIEHDVDAMSIKELEAAVKEKNDALKEKEALEARIKLMIDEKIELQSTVKIQEGEIKAFDSERSAHEKALALLKDKVTESEQLLSQLEVAENDEEPDTDEIERLEAELEKSNETIKALKASLEEKPELVEVVKKVEVIPEATRLEIEGLKSKLSASEDVVKYKAKLQVIVTLFNELADSLVGIKAVDAEQFEKCQGATKKVLGMLMER